MPGGVQLKMHDPLRLNVGFMLHQGVGFSRNFDFDIPELTVEDLLLSSFLGSINLTRTAQGLYAKGKLKAATRLQCVRCLEEYDQELATEVDELFVHNPSKTSDPQLVVPATGILDLNPILRELFLLAIPLRPLCQSDCKALCPICGSDLNQSACNHPEADIDPRLEVLKSFLTEQ